jgi:predicted dehydrogenase
MSQIKAAVVGLGYWGPNLARNIQSNPAFELAALCDRDAKRLAKIGGLYPWAKRYATVDEMLAAGPPDLVVVCTPVESHFELAHAALLAGCNVLCEKPLASTVAQAAQLIDTAAKRGVKLFVDHTFQFTGAVREIRRQYASGALGDLFYIDSVRINLGLFQPDVDVIWDLAPHDLSIVQYVVGARVKSVHAVASSHNPRGLVDVAYLHLDLDNGVSANVHMSWLSPVKVRRMIFSGTRSSLIYDDLEMAEKIKVYDHGVSFDVSDVEARKQVLVNYRRGDMRAPAIDNSEALAAELAEIAAALRGEASAAATGEEGLAIVSVLEASQRSLATGGSRVVISP